MINRHFSITVVAVLVVVCSAISSAAVMERDWLAPGDGLLTFDDVNQREWLDLSVTLLEQFPGATLEEKYQAVLAETNPGGEFEGFSVAQSEDVFALAESAGVDLSTEDFNLNQDAVLNLIDLFGQPVMSLGGRITSYGFVDELSSTSMRRLGFIFEYYPPQPVGGDKARVLVTRSDGMIESTTGAALFRNAIPEPSGLVLLGFSCLAGIVVRWLVNAN